MTRPPGVWMLYHHDYYVHLDSIHTSLEDATQAHVEKGWGEVGYLPYGVELDAAVKAWERGEYAEKKPSPKIDWGNPSLPTLVDRDEAIHERLILANGIQLDEVVARHYREDVPWLLAEVERLRALVDENSAALQEAVRARDAGEYTEKKHEPAHPKDKQ